MRASKQVRARTPARYQSPALKAALERILNRERARASEHGEGHANAPRYQRPWTRFTSLFEPYRTCPYCRATRTSFAAVPAVLAGIGTQMRELFAETYKCRDVYRSAESIIDVPKKNCYRELTKSPFYGCEILHVLAVLSDNSSLSEYSVSKIEQRLLVFTSQEFYRFQSTSILSLFGTC